MSGATGAAGGADGHRQPAGPAGPGGAADPQAGATSVMPSVPPAGAPQPAPGSGYSQPTTYTKGQPTQGGGRGRSGRGGGRGSGGSRGAEGRGGRAAGGPASAARVPGPSASGPALGAPAGPAAAPSGRMRRARLRIARADPWTVMRTSFLLSLALGIVTVVAVSLLWLLLDAAGVFSSLSDTISGATGSDNGNGFNLESFLSFGNVFLFTLVVAVIEVILATALATLVAFIYNTAAEYTGGVEVTLAEED